MAEIFSFLMTDKETIEDKINSDKILNNKVNFIKLNLAKIDKNILWLKLLKPQNQKKFYLYF